MMRRALGPPRKLHEIADGRRVIIAAVGEADRRARRSGLAKNPKTAQIVLEPVGHLVNVG
jgi:hypothetical protein